MDIQTKHIDTLLNAKCQVVCMAENLLKKSDYGDEIGCCYEKLFLAVSLINRLDCYCFPSLEILSSYYSTFDNHLILSGNKIYNLKINGVILSSYKTNGTETLAAVVIILLNSANISFTQTTVGNSILFNMKGNCLVQEIKVSNSDPFEQIFHVGTVGSCVSTCNNCFTDASLNKAYEVLDFLLK